MTNGKVGRTEMKKGIYQRLAGLGLILVLAMSLLLAGCSTNNEEKQPESQPNVPEATVGFTGKYIVDVEYVKNNLGNENIQLIDARGPEAAANGTMEGAIAFVWQDIAKVSEGKAGDPMWGTVMDAPELASRLSELGVDPKKEVILFAAGKNGWGDDGRIAWELIAAGYPNVKMVNGGYDALVNAGLPVVRGAAAFTPTEVEIKQLNLVHSINTTELKAGYDGYKIVDVRDIKEYNGEVLYGEAKGGRLPGAIHLPYTDLFNDDNTLKTVDELKAMFEAAGLSPDDKIVTYCTAGIRSAYMQLILEMCGFEKSINYDESYYRWCAVEEVEV